ncbi:RNA polymerase sigma factor [Streptomyces apocyni]|uniref:RNA polymerase sigma factor n=1 Tax=Streptomyces apocyni TaxID=2654677 RepID=UPI0012EA4324|nr:sigma-70 family RNA polymerase sigma factor [Streptomyces apocyni]
MARSVGTTPPTEMEAAHVRRVRGVLALGGVPWQDLDDGVQQVHLKLLEAEPEIHNLSAWLTVVASRVAADWHRGQARDRGLRERLAARWARQLPDGYTEEDRVLALAIATGMEDLSPAQRQLLTLRFHTDLTVKDIARALRIPEGTVKSRLHTAVAALSTRLQETEVI